MPATPLKPTISLWALLPEALRRRGHRDVAISGLTQDSRAVVPGCLFLALRGLRSDGRGFIPQAIAGGCAAVIAEARDFATLYPADGTVVRAVQRAGIPLVLVDDLDRELSAIAARYYGEPGAALTLFGVTGTNGKTTCASLIAQLTSLLDGDCGLIGTLGQGVASRGQLTLTETGMTTPDAVSLQAILADLRNRGIASAAMEVSSHSLSQHRVEAAGIDCAIFTNLSRDHLDYHGDEASYGAAKARLFALPGVRIAIVNGDDPFGAGLLDNLPPHLEGYSYGFGDTADIRATGLQLSATGMTFNLSSPWGCGTVNSGLLGQFNALNLLAAVAALCASGAELREVLAAVPSLTPVPGRMEVVDGGHGPRVVIDYAHTPDALEKALVSLGAHCGGDLWCVFGCGGDRDAGKRPLMAAVAERGADHLVITSDNPRSEAPEAIIADIVAGLDHPHRVLVLADRRAAIVAAVTRAAVGDTVLIAGKGHENYQQLGAEKLPFSDRDEAALALAMRACATGDQL